MSTRTSSDILTNLSHLLPTGTFLAFQSLAPLFTNNGVCGLSEKVVTGILLGLFFLLCFGMSFVDSVTTDTGKVYYGIVTRKGLYNRQFKKLNLPGDVFYKDAYFTGGKEYIEDYTTNATDFLNGFLNVVTFGALSCLTPPVSTCFYPGLSPTVVKTGPVLAALVVGALFAIFPSGRHGLGYSQTSSGYGFVTEIVPSNETTAPNSDNQASTYSTFLLKDSRETTVEMTDTVSNKV